MRSKKLETVPGAGTLPVWGTGGRSAPGRRRQAKRPRPPEASRGIVARVFDQFVVLGPVEQRRRERRRLDHGHIRQLVPALLVELAGFPVHRAGKRLDPAADPGFRFRPGRVVVAEQDVNVFIVADFGDFRRRDHVLYAAVDEFLALDFDGGKHLRDCRGGHHGFGRRVAHHRGVVAEPGHGHAHVAPGEISDVFEQQPVHAGGVENVIYRHAEQRQRLVHPAGPEQFARGCGADQQFQRFAIVAGGVQRGHGGAGAAAGVAVDPDPGGVERLQNTGRAFDLAAAAAVNHGQNGLFHAVSFQICGHRASRSRGSRCFQLRGQCFAHRVRG